MRKPNIVKAVKQFLKTVEIDGMDLHEEIQHCYNNVRVSAYNPKKQILNRKTEERLHFDNVIQIVFQGQFYPLAFRVVYTAGEEVKIHFLRTTRDERRIITYFDLRERLKWVYKGLLNNIEFWELFAKLYIK